MPAALIRASPRADRCRWTREALARDLRLRPGGFDLISASWRHPLPGAGVKRGIDWGVAAVTAASGGIPARVLRGDGDCSQHRFGSCCKISICRALVLNEPPSCPAGGGAEVTAVKVRCSASQRSPGKAGRQVPGAGVRFDLLRRATRGAVCQHPDPALQPAAMGRPPGSGAGRILPNCPTLARNVQCLPPASTEQGTREQRRCSPPPLRMAEANAGHR